MSCLKLVINHFISCSGRFFVFETMLSNMFALQSMNYYGWIEAVVGVFARKEILTKHFFDLKVGGVRYSLHHLSAMRTMVSLFL